MARFQLTLSPAYVPTWGVFEAVREVIQNALDARDGGFPMNITHNGDTLTVQSDGVALDRSVWLIGNTSKAGTDARGHYGEGLKLGALALVRAGRKLRILNGEETWSCTLEDSSTFPGQQVLTVSTRKSSSKGSQFFHGVSVQIECSPAEWADYRQAFLDLKPRVKTIHTPHGDILVEGEQGNIYVGGIKVESKENLAAGYDFTPATVKTDRDRRMVNQSDFDYYAGLSWVTALSEGDVSPARMLQFLMGDTDDARAAAARYCSPALLEQVAHTWREIYGPLSIPVRDQAAVNEAEHLGRIGRIVPKAVVSFFHDYPEFSLEHLRRHQRANVVRTYEFSDLSENEQDNLGLAIELIDRVASSVGIETIASRTTVVDFKSEEILGTHTQSDGTATIQVARKVLSSVQHAIRVLVHEAAHDRGDDGSALHERTEGLIFGAIVADLALNETALQRWQRKRQPVAA